MKIYVFARNRIRRSRTCGEYSCKQPVFKGVLAKKIHSVYCYREEIITKVPWLTCVVCIYSEFVIVPPRNITTDLAYIIEKRVALVIDFGFEILIRIGIRSSSLVDKYLVPRL